jgi:pimeloyl-ACP methyl ester carboxylesterase
VLTVASRQAISDLAAAMLVTRQLAIALGTPVRVATGAGPADPLEAANAIGEYLGYPPLAAAAGAGPGLPFHGLIERQLAVGDVAEELARIPGPAWPEAEGQARRVAAGDFSALGQRVTVTGSDGTPVPAYVAGDPAAPAVLLSAPCGMPARLAEPWMRYLAGRVRVVTWESRAMFTDLDAFDAVDASGDHDATTGVRAQVEDALAVLNAFGLSSVHVAGLCGGAVVAAELAAAAPSRVSSLSLWHGDFHLGDLAPKTDHQRNLLGLMAMAARSPEAAASVHSVVCQSMLGAMPDDLAAQLLYPYVTPRLFLRYCRLNGAIMRHDITATLPAVKVPTLVVTSRTDATAHPGGSVEVARRLPDAELVVRDRGDHISLFRGEPGSLGLLDGLLGAPARPVQAVRLREGPGGSGGQRHDHD